MRWQHLQYHFGETIMSEYEQIIKNDIGNGQDNGGVSNDFGFCKAYIKRAEDHIDESKENSERTVF